MRLLCYLLLDARMSCVVRHAEMNVPVNFIQLLQATCRLLPTDVRFHCLIPFVCFVFRLAVRSYVLC